MKKNFITKTTLIALIISISLSSCDNVSSSIEVEKKPTTKLKITTPQPSPKATVEQRVGLTDISSRILKAGS